MIEQFVGDLPVVRLSGGQAEPDREPLRVDDDMNLGREPTAHQQAATAKKGIEIIVLVDHAGTGVFAVALSAGLVATRLTWNDATLRQHADEEEAERLKDVTVSDVVDEVR